MSPIPTFQPNNPRSLPLVYVAGPYTHPDPVENTRRAIVNAMSLMETGLMIAYPPHVSIAMHLVDPRPVEFWYEYDVHMLARFDAVFRLVGDSGGAERELDVAHELDIPIFLEEEEDGRRRLIKWAADWVDDHAE